MSLTAAQEAEMQRAVTAARAAHGAQAQEAQRREFSADYPASPFAARPDAARPAAAAAAHSSPGSALNASARTLAQVAGDGATPPVSAAAPVTESDTLLEHLVSLHAQLVNEFDVALDAGAVSVRGVSPFAVGADMCPDGDAPRIHDNLCCAAPGAAAAARARAGAHGMLSPCASAC
jgi:hypothetical protein